MTEEIKLHAWEEKHKFLCFVNLQKNLSVYNLKTDKEDFIHSNVRLYQADDVDKIIKATQKDFKVICERLMKQIEMVEFTDQMGLKLQNSDAYRHFKDELIKNE